MRDLDLVAFIRGLQQTGRLMVGLPDYQTYLSRHRARHPAEPVMTYAEFVRERQEKRYGGGGGGPCRCC